MPARDPRTGRFISGTPSGAPVGLTVEIRGLREFQAKMEQTVSDLRGSPMLEGMREATLLVQRSARQLVPVDTGRLRASIVPEVKQQFTALRGVVGSNVHYAAYVETGTRPHWPPPGALATWSKRHGIPEYLVRKSIGTFGTSKMAMQTIGTKGWRYLERALLENENRIVELLGHAVGRIVAR